MTALVITRRQAAARGVLIRVPHDLIYAFHWRENGEPLTYIHLPSNHLRMMENINGHAP